MEADEAVLVFPEGVRGVNKLFHKRYQLQEFGNGFMRMALAAKAPIVPFAVIGAEEQAPAIYDFQPLAKLIGFPSVPIVFPQIIPLPLPVKYHIHVGAPMVFEGDPDADDEEIALRVKKVHRVIQRMINRGLEKRKGIFV